MTVAWAVFGENGCNMDEIALGSWTKGFHLIMYRASGWKQKLSQWIKYESGLYAYY